MAATVEVLDPDVVIALDPTALGVASGWCDGRRSTTVVELTQDMTYDVELVSWRIGVAQGRLRARIGRGVGAGALADLVNRLCSGPQPLPPTRSPSVSRVDLDLRHRRASVPPSRSKARRAPSTTSIVVISPPTEPTTHMEALATELALTNKVHRLPPDTAEATLVESAALVLISSKVAADQADDIIGRRGATRRPTLIDVEPADAFDLAALAAGEALVRPDLTVAARASVVVVPSRTIGAALRTPTLSPHVVPYLAGRPDMLTLTGAAEDRTPPEHPVIGWRIGRVGPPPAPVAAAVADALLELVAEGVRVEVVARPEDLPATLHDRPELVIHHDEPTPSELAAWTTQIWTPPLGWADLLG